MNITNQISYIITNNNNKEDSSRMYLKKKESSFYFGYMFDSNVIKFATLDEVKYFINNIITFGYNLRIAKIQEELNGKVVISRKFFNVKQRMNKFNLKLEEITKEDVDDLLFPEGRMNLKNKDLRKVIKKRNRLKRQIIIKINDIIDFHNMLDVKFSFTSSEGDMEICDGNCPLCEAISDLAGLLDGPYLNKSLGNYKTAQKRFIDSEGKIKNWDEDDLKILLFDFNTLVKNNPDMTIPEIATDFYQSSKSPFYALLRRVRSFGTIDYLLLEMDKRKSSRAKKNK